MATRAAVLKASKEIALPFDQRLASLIPEHRVSDKKTGRYIVMPHRHDVTRLCRNLGFLVPAPISCYYDWNNDTPFKTQKITAALLTMHRRAYVLSEMGTGKTRAALYAIDYLLQEAVINCALIVAPLSTLSQVWDREVFQYFSHLSVGVLHGSQAKRLEILNEKHDIYVINHDGPKTAIFQHLLAKKFGAIVIDELAVFRNINDRWRAMYKIAKDAPFVWGMTGSPIPTEPLDAWAQCKMLTPARVPQYARDFQLKTMRQITPFKWVAKPDALDTVYAAMQPGVRYKRDDCVELPPVSYIAKKVGMSVEQEKVYKKLVKVLTHTFAEGEVTAANEGVLFSKLLQIAGGWVYTRDRVVVELDNRARVEQLIETIQEAAGKIIVFVEFIHAAKALQKIVAMAGIDSALVTGEVTKTIRDHIFSAFQNQDSPRVLVAHPKCMSHGLTLTAANTIVWYTPTTSLETYEQANARITRPGQTRKQLIVHLSGTPIETKMYKRLQEKKTLQGALLEMFEND